MVLSQTLWEEIKLVVKLVSNIGWPLHLLSNNFMTPPLAFFALLPYRLILLPCHLLFLRCLTILFILPLSRSSLCLLSSSWCIRIFSHIQTSKIVLLMCF